MPIPGNGGWSAQSNTLFEQNQRPSSGVGYATFVDRAPAVHPPLGHFSRPTTPSTIPSIRPSSGAARLPSAGLPSREGSQPARSRPSSGGGPAQLDQRNIARTESAQKRLRSHESSGNAKIPATTRPLRKFQNSDVMLMRGNTMKIADAQPLDLVVDIADEEQDHSPGGSPPPQGGHRGSHSPLPMSPIRSPQLRSPMSTKRKKVSRAEARRYNLALDQMQLEGLLTSLEGVNAAAPGAKPFDKRDTDVERHGRDIAIIKDTLRALIFTSMLSEQHISILASECNLRFYDAGEIIVREGEDCVSLYVLLEGEVGEYRDLENFGMLTVADPIRLATYRANTLTQHMDVFCAMSVFTGAPAHSLYAATTSTIIIRLPTVAFQPILVNQPAVVNRIAEILLGFLLSDSTVDDATRISLANRIRQYHQQFSRDQPGISWRLSPRSRAHNPRAWHKEPDKMGPIPLDPDESQPCVGTKEGPLKPPSYLRVERLKPSTPEISEATHLSPRLYQRDASQGTCSYGLSRKNFSEVVKSNKMSSVQKSFNDQSGTENWAMQETLIEQPLVKRPGVTPCSQGFHHSYASRGSTQATVGELNPSLENPALNRTKLARDVLLAREKEIRREGSRPSYACELRQEAHDSQMRSQLQSNSQDTLSYASVSQTPLELAASPHANPPPPASAASFECKVRHQFSNANMPGVFEHPQYRCSRTDAPANPGEVAKQEAIELDDNRLVTRYPTAFPAEPTHSMLKASPFLIRNAPQRGARASTPQALKKSLSQKSFSPSRGLDMSQGSMETGSPDSRGALRGDEDVSQELPQWATIMRTADTTGLLPPEKEAALHVTYACEMRKQTPFALNSKRAVIVKPSHRFTSLLAHSLPCPVPVSTMQEALERSSKPRVEDLFRDTAPGNKNWAQSLSGEWRDNDMFAVLTHPSSRIGATAHRADRTLHDGSAARSRAQEPEESGKPLIQPPTLDKTRLAMHSSQSKRSYERDQAGPTWVCLERHRTHQ